MNWTDRKNVIASRDGGARVDIEDRDGTWLVHNYGAGGAGYQSSWYVTQESTPRGNVF